MRTDKYALQLVVLVVLAFFWSSVEGWAQGVVLKGKVVDAQGKPIEFASVVVSSDSTGYEEMHFASTREDGSFVVDNLGREPDVRWVHVRSLGYQAEHRQVQLSEVEQPLEFRLEAAAVQVDKVLVRGRGRDVYAKGDTLVYTSRNYITGGERNLGEVINKMPGMEVDKSGNVSYQGKKIGKVLVNGKDVLSSSSGLAMNTLPADFANSVELFKNYNDGDIDRAFRAEEQLALNLKAAKSASINGKLEAGGGVMKRYYAKASLLSLAPPVSITALANGNNIGEPVLSMQDYVSSMVDLQAIRASGGGIAALTLSSEEQALLVPPSDEYGRDAGVANVNLTWIPNDAYRLRSSTLYTVGRSLSASASFEEYRLPDHTLQTNADETFDRQSHKLSQKISQRWIPGARFSLNATTILNGRWTAAGLARWQRVEAQHYDARQASSANSWSAYQGLDMKLLVGKALLFVGINGRYGEENLKSFIEANDAWLPLSQRSASTLYPYSYDLTDRDADVNVSATAGAMYPVYKDIFIKGSVGWTAYADWFRMYAANREANLEKGWRYELKPFIGIVKNKGLLRFQAGAYFSRYDTRLHIGQAKEYSCFRIEPYGNITLKMDTWHSLSLTASESVEPIGIVRFLQRQRLNSYASLRLPSILENPFARTVKGDLNYSYISLFHRLTFYTLASYSLTWDNYASESLSNDGLLVRRRYRDGGRSDNLYAKLYLGKGIGLLPLEVKLRGDYVWGNSKVFSASKPDVIATQSYTLKLELVSRFDASWINFELQGFFSQGDQRQRVSNLKFTSMEYGAEAQCHFKVKAFTATLAGEYSHAQEAARHMQFFDLCARLRYAWKYLELRLQADNILHLQSNQWIRESLTAVSYTRETYGRLPGSIIMTMGYTF